MSRYLILLLLTSPMILAGILNSLVSYKLDRMSRRKLLFQSLLWMIALACLAMAEPLYNFLFSNHLTKTEPLSLFDVIQLSAIMLLVFLVSRYFTKMSALERRVQDLHQELSIRLSQDESKKRIS